MNGETTLETAKFLSVWDIYDPARIIEAIILLSVMVIVFLAGCVAFLKRKKIKGFLWGLGAMSILLFLQGIWRFGHDNFKFHEIFAKNGGEMLMTQSTYHFYQLEIHSVLMVSAILSAVGVFLTMILGILEAKGE